MQSRSASIVKYTYCHLGQSEAGAFSGFNGMCFAMALLFEHFENEQELFLLLVADLVKPNKNRKFPYLEYEHFRPHPQVSGYF